MHRPLLRLGPLPRRDAEDARRIADGGGGARRGRGGRRRPRATTSSASSSTPAARRSRRSRSRSTAWKAGGRVPGASGRRRAHRLLAASRRGRSRRSGSGSRTATRSCGTASSGCTSCSRTRPTLGSLIDPTREEEGLFAAGWGELKPLLAKAMAGEKKDEEARELGVAARGIATAAEILAGRYTLVATNVPYLAKGKHDRILLEFLDRRFPESKADLATVFVERITGPVDFAGTTGVVTPQNWLFLDAYKLLRRRLLSQRTWNAVARLGARGFDAISGEIVQAALVVVSGSQPSAEQRLLGIDASAGGDAGKKATILRSQTGLCLLQRESLMAADSRVVLAEPSNHELLELLASAYQGVKTGDDPKWRRAFWEMPARLPGWRMFQTTTGGTSSFAGLHNVLDWRTKGEGIARLQGKAAWGRRGVAVSQMSDLPVSLFLGDAFDSNMSPIVPLDEKLLPAIWAFCSSVEFGKEVRKIDQTLKVTNATLVKIPFDRPRWEAVARKQYPHGLPSPLLRRPDPVDLQRHDHSLHRPPPGRRRPPPRLPLAGPGEGRPRRPLRPRRHRLHPARRRRAAGRGPASGAPRCCVRQEVEAELPRASSSPRPASRGRASTSGCATGSSSSTASSSTIGPSSGTSGTAGRRTASPPSSTTTSSTTSSWRS